jgi:hypothetical protein
MEAAKAFDPSRRRGACNTDKGSPTDGILYLLRISCLSHCLPRDKVSAHSTARNIFRKRRKDSVPGLGS